MTEIEQRKTLNLSTHFNKDFTRLRRALFCLFFFFFFVVQSSSCSVFSRAFYVCEHDSFRWNQLDLIAVTAYNSRTLVDMKFPVNLDEKTGSTLHELAIWNSWSCRHSTTGSDYIHKKYRYKPWKDEQTCLFIAKVLFHLVFFSIIIDIYFLYLVT